MRGVRDISGATKPVVAKTYYAKDTTKYQCLGSGAKNEARLPASLVIHAPRLIGHRSFPNGDEEVLLERIEGDVLGSHALTSDHLAKAGAMLALIHAERGAWYGSLDGAARFDDQAQSFAVRWAAALELLHDVDSGASHDLRAWGCHQLESLVASEPTMVHGDYGALNLVWPGTANHPVVLDWEHARYGDRREDWAKLALALRFPEPNACFTTEDGFDTFRAAYLAASNEVDAVTSPPILYLVYYAVVLAVFFEDERRLQWAHTVTR